MRSPTLSFSFSRVRKTVGLALPWLAWPRLLRARRRLRIPSIGPSAAFKLNATLYELHCRDDRRRLVHLFPASGSDGPIPTTVRFAKNPSAVPQGAIKEVGRMIKVDPVFAYKVSGYENTIDFVAPVAKRGNGPTTVKGSVEFMASRSQQRCRPSRREFRDRPELAASERRHPRR